MKSRLAAMAPQAEPQKGKFASCDLCVIHPSFMHDLFSFGAISTTIFSYGQHHLVDNAAFCKKSFWLKEVLWPVAM